jgi:type II secretion system protein N
MSGSLDKVLSFLRNAQDSATRAYSNLNARPSTKSKVLRWMVFGGAFVFGLLIFFPTATLEGRLASTLSQATRMDVSLSQLSVGTGLKAGLLRGGLLGFHVRELKISSRSFYWECPTAVISPKMLSLFVGKLSLAFVCDRESAGEISGEMGASPAWGPKQATISIELDDVKLQSLASLSPGLNGLQGTLSGDLIVRDYDLALGRSGEINWELEAEDLQTPAVNSDLLVLPPLLIGPLASEGRLKGPRLELDSFDFGGDKGAMQGKIKAKLGMDRAWRPTNGEISGSLKIEANFETQQLASLGGTKTLDFLFGPVKPSGAREFRKPVQGGPMSLYNPPAQ